MSKRLSLLLLLRCTSVFGAFLPRFVGGAFLGYFFSFRCRYLLRLGMYGSFAWTLVLLGIILDIFRGVDVVTLLIGIAYIGSTNKSNF